MAHDEKGGGFSAVVTSHFRGCRDGERHATAFTPGDHVSGDLARVAISQGWAKAIGAAPENKAVTPGKPDGPTGREKPLSSRQAGQAKAKTISKRPRAKRS